MLLCSSNTTTTTVWATNGSSSALFCVCCRLLLAMISAAVLCAPGGGGLPTPRSGRLAPGAARRPACRQLRRPSACTSCSLICHALCRSARSSDLSRPLFKPSHSSDRSISRSAISQTRFRTQQASFLTMRISGTSTVELHFILQTRSMKVRPGHVCVAINRYISHFQLYGKSGCPPRRFQRL
jgi:hypothetical protein